MVMFAHLREQMELHEIRVGNDTVPESDGTIHLNGFVYHPADEFTVVRDHQTFKIYRTDQFGDLSAQFNTLRVRLTRKLARQFEGLQSVVNEHQDLRPMGAVLTSVVDFINGSIGKALSGLVD
jgi:hypothetical protein